MSEEPINSIIERIGKLGRALDVISQQVSDARTELIHLLDDVLAEVHERSAIIDRIDAGLKESFAKAESRTPFTDGLRATIEAEKSLGWNTQPPAGGGE
jgi:hypothetical protein